MYISGVVAFLAIVIGVPTYFILKKPPTCFDRKMNQDERGVDCGGVCSLVCTQDTAPLVVLWSRTFHVTEGVYNALAYIENPNATAVAYDVPYIFRVFDEKNVLITERKGVTDITSQGVVPIFEGAIDTGWRVPGRTFFEFTAPIVWVKKGREPHLVIAAQTLKNVDESPRLEAQLQDIEVYDVKNIEVVATIFDEQENAMAASRTIIPIVYGQSSKPLIFTWPKPFPRASSRIEIIPRVHPEKN